MELFFNFVFILGAIGAYAMALGIVAVVKHEAGWASLLMFIYPGMIYIIGYSFLGFLWGLMVWRLFAEDGPIRTIITFWREDPWLSLVGTTVIAAVWLLCGWVLSQW